jgi:hypothetical protein
VSHFGYKGQKGLALIWALIMLAVGSTILTPMLVYAITALRTEAIVRRSLFNEYTAEAAFEWSMWKLLWTSDIDVDESDPIWEGSFDFNGEVIPIILSLVPLGDFIDEALPGVDVDNYRILTGRQMEFKIIVPTDTEPRASFAVWFAYDTVLRPAQTYVPSPDAQDPSGIDSWYWHNNPTPPVGDTPIQHPLPLDRSIPTADILYNYDTPGGDDDPGRIITVGPGADENEVGEKKMQEWRTDTFTEDYTVDGQVGLLYWWGMKNFTYDKHAVARFFMRDYDPVSETYAEHPYTALTVSGRVGGNFNAGDTITGDQTGAAGEVVSDDGVTVEVSLFRDLTVSGRVGGNFNAGDTITGDQTGATGEVVSDDGVTVEVVLLTNINFDATDNVDNGGGKTADVDSVSETNFDATDNVDNGGGKTADVDDVLDRYYFAEITHIQQEWARLFDFSTTLNDVTINGRIRLYSDRVEILSVSIE